MQIYTQNWLNSAKDYLNSFSTRCSNGGSLDLLCLKPHQYGNLGKVIDDFAGVHRQARSQLRDHWNGQHTWEHRCLIGACYDEENCCNDAAWTERGAAFSMRVRYLGPLEKQAPDDYARLAFYKETFECKAPIDLPSVKLKETEFGSEEMTQLWSSAGWKAPVCEWQAEHCKVSRFANVTHADDTGIQFECRDAVCLDRNSIEDGADCTMIAKETLDFDAPFTRDNIPSGMIPLVSGGEIKDPWMLTLGTVSAVAFALLTCHAIRTYRSLSQMQPDAGKPSFRPVWACAVATAASAIATLSAYQNLTRIYSVSFL